MKMTDYALIFIGITLPFILIAYINIAFAIRTFQQEMYYQKVIDAAVEDTLSEMKRIENDEITNDYGYSGVVDNKISINADVAVSTFFDSLYNSLDLYADTSGQSIFQLYVPVVAIIDYNGVYISSIEEIEENGKEVTKHVLKPKRYFAYEYALDEKGNFYTIKDGEWVSEWYIEYGTKPENDKIVYRDTPIIANKDNFISIHNIEFTTDDRIFHTAYQKVTEVYGGRWVTHWKSTDTMQFYIDDFKNNQRLYPNVTEERTQNIIRSHLKEIREIVLVDIVTEELVYAANKNNEFAKEKGITYNFAFTLDSDDEMYNYIKNVGVLALVQGIKVGNKYLNYKAYNVSDLILTNKYYLTTGSAKFATKLYHKTTECLEYKVNKGNVIQNNNVNGDTQNITYTRENAASLGYYPCPLCNP